MQHIISVIEQHGLLIVFLNVLLAQGGVPLPAFPTLMTAAALVTQSRYQVPEIILAGVSGSMIADLAWYWGGKRYGRRILGLLCKISFLRISAFAKQRRCSLKPVPGRCCSLNSFPGLRLFQ